MTDTSSNLGLPYIADGQALKHITHNEALQALDALVQIGIVSRGLNTPPETPTEGERYIVGASGSGGWAGKDNQLAAYQNGAWKFYAPQTGWLLWIADEAELVVWTGADWGTASGDQVNPAALVGVNTEADATNKLSVKSDAVLLSHDDVTPGSGDMQVKLNKANDTKTGSFLFQSDWSGRAEFGLTGDDDWHVKVSPDGSAWTDAMIVDKTTGLAAVQGLKSIPAGYATASTMIFTPGGDGTISIYRTDTTSGQNPRTATIDSISGQEITLTAAVADTIFGNIMGGVVYARIWNTTLSAASDGAWVEAYIDSDTIRVRAEDDLTGWAGGHAIQIGDPTSITPNTCITLDISPMLINLFGQAFRQTGITVKSNLLDGSSGDSIAMSPTGANGSFVTSAVLGAYGGTTTIPCTELSPISNSNLVRVREKLDTNAGIRLLSCIGVYV